jgi:hypothetical protein
MTASVQPKNSPPAATQSEGRAQGALRYVKAHPCQTLAGVALAAVGTVAAYTLSRTPTPAASASAAAPMCPLVDPLMCDPSENVTAAFANVTAAAKVAPVPVSDGVLTQAAQLVTSYPLVSATAVLGALTAVAVVMPNNRAVTSAVVMANAGAALGTLSAIVYRTARAVADVLPSPSQVFDTLSRWFPAGPCQLTNAEPVVASATTTSLPKIVPVIHQQPSMAKYAAPFPTNGSFPVWSSFPAAPKVTPAAAHNASTPEERPFMGPDQKPRIFVPRRAPAAPSMNAWYHNFSTRSGG